MTDTRSLRQIDTEMESVYADYCQAMDDGDLERADRKYAEMDALLEQRCHHKQDH